jgi:hypothetical protein
MTPYPNPEATTYIPHITLCKNMHNPHAWVAHSYILVEDLAQSPTSMSVLEVLHTCPSQRKDFLSQLGAVDSTYTCLITFDLDKVDPCLPSLVSFQIPFMIKKIIVQHCIIDDGESTCIMSKHVWKHLGYPELIPSTITLRAYDGDLPNQKVFTKMSL